MPPLTVRLPLPVLARLKALAVVRGVSPSTVVADALNNAFDAVNADDARTLGSLARREAGRLRERFPDAE
jgi:predicted transcriptional regulator